jgi:hypothetical protein
MRFLFLTVFLMLLLPAQMAWAGQGACQAQKVPSVSIVLFGEPDPFEALDWEFAPDQELDIVEQFSAPSWDGVQLGKLSCRAVEDKDDPLPPLPGPDGHEFDFPLLSLVLDPPSGDALFSPRLDAPPPAPVFSFFRPPLAA